MGGILEVAQIGGFLDNLDAERENMAPEKDAWREFVHAWFEQFGTKSVTAKELIEVALRCEGISAQLGEKDGKSKRLGDFLSRKRDQIFADFQIQKAAEKSKFGVKWRLFALKPVKTSNFDPIQVEKGDAGDAGLGSPCVSEKKQESQNTGFLEKDTSKSKRLNPASPASPFDSDPDEVRL